MYSYYERDKTSSNKSKKSLEIFIPCYDIINNEIYFFNFFDETVISKSNIDYESQDDPYSEEYNLNPKLSNNIKNSTEKDINLNESFDSSDYVNKLRPEHKVKLSKCIKRFQKNWEKMKLLTKFNSVSTLPGEY